MRRTMIDATAAHPRRWAAQFGLALAGAQFVGSLLAGGTASVTGAAATGIAVWLVFWGVGSLLKRQRDAAPKGGSDGRAEEPTTSEAPIDQRQTS